jgi:L-ectoine synthase
MIVRTLAEITRGERDVSGPGWRSRRIVLADDGMDHSLHYTEIDAGAEITLWYKHHFESNLCVAGEGEVVDLATGTTHPIAPGTLYALDRHDRHVLRARTPLTLVCVFTPALSGHETHDADGSYEPRDA